MYQKLVIREADAHVRELDASRDDVIRPDRMIICSDWLTILRCNTTFGYKKDDGRGCGKERERERERERVKE